MKKQHSANISNFNFFSLTTLSLLVVVLVAGCSTTVNKEKSVVKPINKENKVKNERILGANDKASIEEVMSRVFAEKYELPETSFAVSIEEEEDNFVRGQVIIGGQGALFLAVKQVESWKIIFDGNGSYKCSLVNEYGFPNDLITDCFQDFDKNIAGSCEDEVLEDYIIKDEDVDDENILMTEIIIDPISKAKPFEQQINKQIKDGADFAVYYKIVTWNCGDECSDHIIVDLRNEEIVQFGLPSQNELEYSIDSNLIKVDNSYYVLEGDKLKIVCRQGKALAEEVEEVKVRIDKEALSGLKKQELNLEDEEQLDEGQVRGAFEIRKINLSAQERNK